MFRVMGCSAIGHCHGQQPAGKWLPCQAAVSGKAGVSHPLGRRGEEELDVLRVQDHESCQPLLSPQFGRRTVWQHDLTLSSSLNIPAMSAQPSPVSPSPCSIITVPVCFCCAGTTIGGGYTRDDMALFGVADNTRWAARRVLAAPRSETVGSAAPLRHSRPSDCISRCPWLGMGLDQ